MSKPCFIRVPVRLRDGEPTTMDVNVDDIACVKDAINTPGSIIERMSNPEYPVWSTSTKTEVNEAMEKCGVRTVAI